MAKSRSERVAINTSASIVQNLISQLMGFIMLTVFIKTLGKQYNSVNTLFSDILAMFTLAEMGIANAIAFALYKPLKQRDEARVAALMRFFKLAYRCVAAVIAVAGFLCVPFLLNLVDPQKVPHIQESIQLIFILMFMEDACTYLLIYKSTLLNADQKRYEISKISIVFSFIRTGVQCVLLFVFHNYILYLLVSIVETLLRNYTISRVADRQYPYLSQHPDAKLEKGEIKLLFKDVWALFLYRANYLILSSTDSIIIAKMVPGGLAAIGALGCYKTINKTIDGFMNQFFLSALPSLGNIATGADHERQHKVFKMVQFISFWLACFCATSLFNLSSPFVRLWFGKDYVQPMLLVFSMVFDFYILSLMRPVNTFRNANGLFVQGKYRPLAMALINVALSIALAVPLGIFGVLFATTISRLATIAWYDPYLVYRRVFQKPVSDYWKRYLQYFAITVLSVLTVYVLSESIATGSAILDFLIRMAFCVAIPNGFIILIYRGTEEYNEFVSRFLAIWRKITEFARRKLRRG